MNTTTLQVPIDKNIRNKAALKATQMGFSSLQEVVRVFLSKVAAGTIDTTFEPVVKLSAKNDKRYSKIIEEIKSGKAKLRSFSDIDEMIAYLNGNN